MFKIRHKAFAVALLTFASLMGQAGTSSILVGTAQAQAPADNGYESMIRIKLGDKKTRNLKVGLNKSTIVELPVKVSDVLVSNPKLLDAVVHTSKRVYLIGLKPGQVNVFFFDKNGAQISTLEVSIERDVSKLTETLNRLIPGSTINVETLGENIILTGSVRNPGDSTRASNIAKRIFKAGKKNVMNMLAVQSKEQVMLKVIVAEMNRKVAKELKVELSAAMSSGGASAGLINAAGVSGLIPEALLPQTTRGLSIANRTGSGYLASTFKMLEENGLVKTLAEPTLTALSGETAKFHAGGEFGYVTTTYQDGTTTYTVAYKDYGVQLNFTPVVLSEERISLKIKSNVSEIDGEILAGENRIPSLTKRETETTIELPSGGSMIIGGLISERTRQNLDGIPGLKDLPILGSLFSSKSYKKEETELVVIVTPYMVKPVSRNKLRYPGQGFAPASDAKRNLLGRANRVYGHRKEVVNQRSEGCCGKPLKAMRQRVLSATGFIVD